MISNGYYMYIENDITGIHNVGSDVMKLEALTKT